MVKKNEMIALAKQAHQGDAESMFQLATKRILCLLLIAAMMIPFVGCSGNAVDKQSGIATEESIQPADLTLTISEDLFLLDKQTILEIQVTCQQGVTGDIRIKDETGTIIALLENDGSGSLKTQIPFRRSTIGSGSLTAYTGEFTSAPVEYEVQPEVTEEMVETLYDIGNELGAYVVSCGFADPYSEEAFRKVEKYLEDNDSIAKVVENNGILLYQTIDGLVGSYGMGRRTEGLLGFSDATQVYEDWAVDLDVSDKYIESPVAPTSEKCIILCADYEDSIMRRHADGNYAIISQVFQNTSLITGASAKKSMAAGAFVDCELLFLTGHGELLERPDGSNMLMLSIEEIETNEELVQAFDESDSEQYLWMQDIEKVEDCSLALCIIVDEDGNYNTYLFYSTHYLENALDDKTFDNTVIFLAACSALSDIRFANFLLEHGASMVIGCEKPLYVEYSLLTIYEISKTLQTKNTESVYQNYRSAIDNVDKETVSDFLIHHLGYSEEEVREAEENYEVAFGNQITMMPSDYEESNAFDQYIDYYLDYEKSIDEERTFSYIFRTQKHSDHVLYGESDVTGYVVYRDGTPAEGAMVTLYRWKDHDFKKYEHQAVVNANGKYSFTDVPIGVYAVVAEQNGSTDYTTVTIDEPETEVEDLILNADQVVIWGQAQWKDATSQENYSSYLVEPIVLQSPNGQVDKLLSDEWTSLMDVVEGQIGVVAGNSSSNSEYSGVVDLTVDSIYFAGDVLSVRMSAISYAAGQAHPWRGGCVSNILVSNGENAVLSDILQSGSDYPNIRAGWMKLMEGINDLDLTQSKESIVDKAMNGQLGTWSLTTEGLEVGFVPYEISSYKSYSGTTLIPYDQLKGELKSACFPPEQSKDQNAPSVALVSGSDARFSGGDYMVWGDVTNSVIAFDGTATHVSICAVNSSSDAKDDSVLFYANTLTDALIWLPECESGLYRVRWIVGDTYTTTMIKVS